MTRPGTVPWAAEFAGRYAAAGYWQGRPLGSWLWTWADERDDRPVVVDGDTAVSYRELAERADALAANFKALGLKPGDNILVQLPNGWEFLAVFFACQRLGVAPLLALMPHREHELGYLGDLVGATAIVTVDRWQGTDHQDLAARLVKETDRTCRVLILGEDVRQDDGHVGLRPMLVPRKNPDTLRRRLDAAAPGSAEVAVFLLSGGTTGLPKVIARTHDDYEYNARASAAACGFDAGTVYLATLPMAHNFPLASPGVLGTFVAGGTVVTVPSPNPDVAFPAIARNGVTVTSVVPAIARRWMDAAATRGAELASLRVVQVGGSVLPPEFAARIGLALGCTLQQVYGMAEPAMPERTPAAQPAAPAEGGRMSRWQLTTVLTVLLSGQLLSALDQTIIGTALPTIVGEVGSLRDLALVVTAYLLTSTVSTAMYGKLADLYGPKPMYLSAIAIFTGGALLAGLSQNMTQLVAFRAVQGIGGGGLVVLAFTSCATVLPPRDLGRIQGLVGAMYALASLAGPLIGGAFTQYLSWRWCFLVNVPVGLGGLLAVALLLRLPAVQRDAAVDYRGASLLVAGVSGLMLLNVWGGSRYDWGSPVILAIVAGCLLLAALPDRTSVLYLDPAAIRGLEPAARAEVVDAFADAVRPCSWSPPR